MITINLMIFGNLIIIHSNGRRFLTKPRIFSQR
jgi:hypothetical protein